MPHFQQRELLRVKLGAFHLGQPESRQSIARVNIHKRRRFFTEQAEHHKMVIIALA